MMLQIELTKRQAEWLLKLLHGPSRADAKAATIYEAVQRSLHEQSIKGQPTKEATP